MGGNHVATTKNGGYDVAPVEAVCNSRSKLACSTLVMIAFSRTSSTKDRTCKYDKDFESMTTTCSDL